MAQEARQRVAAGRVAQGWHKRPSDAPCGRAGRATMQPAASSTSREVTC